MELLQPVNTEQTQPTDEVPADNRQEQHGDGPLDNDHPPPTVAAVPAVAGAPLVDTYEVSGRRYCRTSVQAELRGLHQWNGKHGCLGALAKG